MSLKYEIFESVYYESESLITTKLFSCNEKDGNWKNHVQVVISFLC